MHKAPCRLRPRSRRDRRPHARCPPGHPRLWPRLSLAALAVSGLILQAHALVMPSPMPSPSKLSSPGRCRKECARICGDLGSPRVGPHRRVAPRRRKRGSLGIPRHNDRAESEMTLRLWSGRRDRFESLTFGLLATIGAHVRPSANFGAHHRPTWHALLAITRIRWMAWASWQRSLVPKWPTLPRSMGAREPSAKRPRELLTIST